MIERHIRNGTITNFYYTGVRKNGTTFPLEIHSFLIIEKGKPVGIAHDFNNILTAILGNIRLSKINIPLDSPKFDFPNDAETAGFRAKDLTQQLLTFS